MIDIDKLKKKERILDKIAEILAINLIWDSNKGLPDKHKTEIEKLLVIYYNIIGDEYKNGVRYE